MHDVNTTGFDIREAEAAFGNVLFVVTYNGDDIAIFTTTEAAHAYIMGAEFAASLMEDEA